MPGIFSPSISASTLASLSTGASGKPVWPSDITGLVLWLAADQIQGIASGTSLSAWTDSSASGSHATQPSVLSQPLFQAGVKPFGTGIPLSAVSFGNTACTVLVSTTSIHDSTTIALVGNPTGIAGTTERWLGGHSGTSPRLTKQTSGQQNALTKWVCGTTMITSANLPQTWQSIIVHTQVGSTSTTTMTQNASVTTDISGTTSGATSATMDIGANNLSTITISAYMGEICVFNRPIVESERSQLNSYFNQKWGLF